MNYPVKYLFPSKMLINTVFSFRKLIEEILGLLQYIITKVNINQRNTNLLEVSKIPNGSWIRIVMVLFITFAFGNKTNNVIYKCHYHCFTANNLKLIFLLFYC